MFLLVSGRHVSAHLGGHQHGVSLQISINLEHVLKTNGLFSNANFWQESVTFMKFLPKAVKSELRLVRFLKKKLNVAKKSLHVVTFTSKSMISSKVKACEMQNLQGT